MKLRIGITADLPEKVKREKGVSRYIRELVDRLDDEVTLVPLKRRRDVKNVDVVHIMAPRVQYFPYLTKRKPVVVTVHGMDFYWPDSLKATILQPAAFLQQQLIPQSTRWIDHYITVSQFLKNELISGYDISESKITPVYHGVSDIFYPGDVEREKFILTTTPEREVIRAFSAISNDYHLLVVGKRGYGYSAAREEADRLRIDNIRFLGHVTEFVLTSLYRKATCYVHWSGYEGFGLPPVEAMGSKTATISNDAGSLPEVVGEGGIIVTSEDQLKRKLQHIVRDEGYRKRVAERGYQWSNQYQWEKTVEETISVYFKSLGLNNRKYK